MAAQILFANKADGILKLCVDYKKLSQLMIDNKYSLASIDELFDQFRGSKSFSKIDLRSKLLGLCPNVIIIVFNYLLCNKTYFLHIIL